MAIWYNQDLHVSHKNDSDKEAEIDVFGQLYDLQEKKSKRQIFVETIRNFALNKHYIPFTRQCALITTDFRTSFIRIILITLAILILLHEAKRNKYKGENSPTEIGIKYTDILVNIYFLIDAIIRLLGIPMFIRIEYAFGREANGFNLILKSGSFRDILIVILCLSYGITITGLWLRLLLVVSLIPSFIEIVPKLSILLSSITKALKSIFITIALFFLSIMIYASFGHILFSHNDPYHFGSYGLSLWSFFHIAIFDNWTEIWNINYFGCDKYPSSDITIINSNNISLENEIIITKYGTFQLGLCIHPEASPLLSTIVFLSFVLISAYVLVNTIMAAVAIGIKGGLDIYKNMELLGDENKYVVEEALVDEVAAKHTHSSSPTNTTNSANRRASVVPTVNNQNAKILKMTGGNKEAEGMKRTLLKIWTSDSKSSRKKSNLEVTYGPWTNSNRISAEYELFLQSNLYRIIYVCSSIIVAILQILVELLVLKRIEIFSIFVIFQSLFSFDLFMRLFTYIKRNPKDKSEWGWLIFGSILTIILWFPIFLNNSDRHINCLNSCHIIRLVAALQFLSWIRDLKLIMTAFTVSIFGIILLCILAIIAFFIFVVAGLLLFQESDPAHFGTISSS